MVSKADLVAIAKKEKISLGVVEKDFVLTFFLRKIYGSELKDKLVFKGGTALHKLYLHQRFSIDLDFTALNEIHSEIFRNVLEDVVIQSEIKDLNEIGNSTRIVLQYISVLEFRNRIFLDISKREEPVIDLVHKKVRTPFFDDFEVLTYQLEELLAEKLRALMQRKKPRDYLDLYFVLESESVDLDKTIEIANVKLSAFQENFDSEQIFNETELVEQLWEQDLREILPTIPDFNDVLDVIRSKFKV